MVHRHEYVHSLWALKKSTIKVAVCMVPLQA